MNATEACVALNLLPGMGPVRMRRLLERFGEPGAILAASSRALCEVEGIGPDVAAAITHWREKADPVAEIGRARAFGAEVLTQADGGYPNVLREIHDAPIVLYVLGDAAALSGSCLGVVGTRKPSVYAADCARKLSYQLSYAGVTVVSGLARGIDTAAHQAALAAKGRTVAVLGSALDELYPPENRELADRIVASGGALVSEFSMGTIADRRTFPMRNRIVSGLSFGLLVVEAGGRSGALITANQAAEQGRSIYAIPGRIDHPGALGSNRLIQQGAKLVLSAQDILDDLGLLFRDVPELARPATGVTLGETERLVYEALGDDETAIDVVISKCRLPTPEVSSTLLALEMRRLVKQLPGGRFVKVN